LRDKELSKIGNLLDPNAPIFESEDYNEIVETVFNNKPTEYIQRVVEEQSCTMPLGFTENLLETKTCGKTGFLEHWELMSAINGLELERGRKVSGHRGYFMTGDLMRLNMAL